MNEHTASRTQRLEQYINTARQSAVDKSHAHRRMVQAAMDNHTRLVELAKNCTLVCIQTISVIQDAEETTSRTPEDFESLIVAYLNTTRACVEQCQNMPMFSTVEYTQHAAKSLESAENWLRVATEAVARLILCLSVESKNNQTVEAFVADSSSLKFALEDARLTLTQAQEDADDYEDDESNSEMLMEAFAAGGMDAYNEARGYDAFEPEPCGHHCADDCARCGRDA